MSASETDTVLDWWQHNIADRNNSAARGLAARLRRAGTIEALAEQQVHQLGRRIGLTGPYDGQRLADIARTLAEVRENSSETLFRRLGPSSPDAEDALLSRLRFQRLLRSEGEERLTAIRRAITMADRRCNVAQLGRDLQWLDTERTLQRWCFDYFRGDEPAVTPDKISEDE